MGNVTMLLLFVDGVFLCQVGQTDEFLDNHVSGHGSFVGIPAAGALGELFPTIHTNQMALHALQHYSCWNLQTAGALEVKFAQEHFFQCFSRRCGLLRGF